MCVKKGRGWLGILYVFVLIGYFVLLVMEGFLLIYILVDMSFFFCVK